MRFRLHYAYRICWSREVYWHNNYSNQFSLFVNNFLLHDTYLRAENISWHPERLIDWFSQNQILWILSKRDWPKVWNLFYSLPAVAMSQDWYTSITNSPYRKARKNMQKLAVLLGQSATSMGDFYCNPERSWSRPKFSTALLGFYDENRIKHRRPKNTSLPPNSHHIW